MKKSLILGAAIAGTLSSGAAMAIDGLSANAGIVSDYYFRGVQQTASASANASQILSCANTRCTETQTWPA